MTLAVVGASMEVLVARREGRFRRRFVIQPTLIRGHFAVWFRIGHRGVQLLLQAEPRRGILREPLGHANVTVKTS